MARTKSVQDGEVKAAINEIDDTVKESQVNSNKYFNVKPIHVDRIKKLLSSGYDEVIIHGDGSMFAGRKGQLFNGKSHKEGSDFHKEFHSGVEEINKNEKVARGKYRAFYKFNGKLPQTCNDIISDFYVNLSKESQMNTLKEDENKTLSNVVVLND